jgi:hypothetical protein
MGKPTKLPSFGLKRGISLTCQQIAFDEGFETFDLTESASPARGRRRHRKDAKVTTLMTKPVPESPGKERDEAGKVHRGAAQGSERAGIHPREVTSAGRLIR